MGLGSSAKVLAAGALWRLTGAGGAGRTLAAAAASEDEDASTLAATLLARGGDRAVDVIEDALGRGAESPVLVDVLASIRSPDARSVLESIASRGGPIGEEALKALRYLDDTGGEAADTAGA